MAQYCPDEDKLQLQNEAAGKYNKAMVKRILEKIEGEVIKKLLDIDPELKAIVSSGYSDDPVLSNFQEYGFRGVIPKPFESWSLGKVLHEVLNGEKK